MVLNQMKLGHTGGRLQHSRSNGTLIPQLARGKSRIIEKGALEEGLAPKI